MNGCQFDWKEFNIGPERFSRRRCDFPEKISKPVNVSSTMATSHYMISMLWPDAMSVGTTF